MNEPRQYGGMGRACSLAVIVFSGLLSAAAWAQVSEQPLQPLPEESGSGNGDLPVPINSPGGGAAGSAAGGGEVEATMVAFIQAVSRTTMGTHLFLLSNGQQWEQVRHGNVSLQQGDQIRISRMRGGHYVMLAADGSRRPIDVRPH